jgi:hypothetical protein
MRRIFVFGSNEAGRHGAGTALEARRRYGAIYGCGRGLQGDSYAIPTKDRALKPRKLEEIKIDVDEFLAIARETPPGILYILTPIGCGLAGYKPEQIGPMFKGAPPNVELPPAWEKWRW